MWAAMEETPRNSHLVTGQRLSAAVHAGAWHLAINLSSDGILLVVNGSKKTNGSALLRRKRQPWRKVGNVTVALVCRTADPVTRVVAS